MRTLFNSNDPGTVKKWSSQAMSELERSSFFVSRMTGGEDRALPIVYRSDLESGPGDEVTLYLTVNLTGAPIRGEVQAQGKAKRMTDFTMKVKIDRHRYPVSVGNLMSQKRRPFDLKKLAVSKVGIYWGAYLDQDFFAHMSGQRGDSAAMDKLEPDYAGFPMPLLPPDAQHILYPNAIAAKNQLTAGDLMSKALLDKVSLRADTMVGPGINGKPWKMEMCSVEGGKYWVLVMHPGQMHDLKTETGDSGWLALEKARAAAIGSNSPIFKGEAGATVMYNQVILHKHTTITTLGDYGAGANIRGYRALFMGAHAASIAFGTEDRSKNGVRLQMGEYLEDLGDDTVVKSASYMGITKNRFNGQDTAVIAVDTAVSTAAAAGMVQ